MTQTSGKQTQTSGKIDLLATDTAERTQGSGTAQTLQGGLPGVCRGQNTCQPSQLCIRCTRLLPSLNWPDSSLPSSPQNQDKISIYCTSPTRCYSGTQVISFQMPNPQGPFPSCDYMPSPPLNASVVTVGCPPVFSPGLCPKSHDLKTFQQCMKQGNFLKPGRSRC